MNNINEDIIRFIYIISMRDATIQNAYKGDKKWLTEEKMFNELKNCLTDFIEKIIFGEFNNEKDYNKEFNTLLNNICDTVNNQKHKVPFTYGNAQKLANMMIKYVYITTLGDVSRDYFKYCHCPMDGKMLASAYDNLKSIKTKYTKTSFTKAWSNEDKHQRYNDFQEAIRELSKNEGIYPIEYDYKHWN